MTTAARPESAAALDEVAVAAKGRLAAIDVLRGLVMVVMVLDHVRDYFHDSGFDPTDPERAGVALFLTRWVTHLCAPTFVFLAGVGAYLHGQRITRTQLAAFLATRGAWLILLDLTVVKFGMMFRLAPDRWLAIVLWAIGWSMIALAALVFLPTRLVAALGVAVIVLHNLADGVGRAAFGRLGPLWVVLHRQEPILLPGGVRLFIYYPLVPWIGVMAAGFGFGAVFALERHRRRRLVATLGLALIAGFVALRAANVYGDPARWVVGSRPIATLLSFLNCRKYPPSLLYLLMTLGPALLLLAAFDRPPGPVARRLATLGRVPLLFYVLQWYVIHGLAVATAFLRGRPSAAQPSLAVVYLVWVVVVLLLYEPCRRFAALKRRRKDAWLSFL